MAFHDFTPNATRRRRRRRRRRRSEESAAERQQGGLVSPEKHVNSNGDTSIAVAPCCLRMKNDRCRSQGGGYWKRTQQAAQFQHFCISQTLSNSKSIIWWYQFRKFMFVQCAISGWAFSLSFRPIWTVTKQLQLLLDARKGNRYFWEG